jgi:hypothetical protein
MVPIAGFLLGWKLENQKQEPTPAYCERSPDNGENSMPEFYHSRLGKILLVVKETAD